MPDTVYGPLYFADQDWRNPDRKRYMTEIARYRPEMASVVDLEREGQLPEVLDWAEEAAQYVQRVVIIPKVVGIAQRLPHRIGRSAVVLGYSVPTRYAGTAVPVWEFAGWPVHLLGGSPHQQMRLSHYLNVVSADGNMMSKMAVERCQFWRWQKGSKGHWVSLEEADGERWGEDAPYEAFRRSCLNIAQAWYDFWRGVC